MSQGSLTIANQSFPSFRTSLNSALQAINTTQSGTSRPSGAVAGTIWLDTTSATSPTLKIYDGADDISLATINYVANTVDWLDSSVTITGLSTTATGTVLTLSDTSLTSSVNLILQNQKEIRFSEATANGANYVGFKAPASLTADKIWVLPSADGTAGQFLKTDGAGNLSFADGGITGLTTTATGTVMTLSDTANTTTQNLIIDNQKEVRWRETTANGVNFVGLKAPASLTADTTFTLPSADGTSGQVLQTNGSGVLSFSTPSAGSFVFLGETTATNVSTVDLNGYFTSSYDYYEIYLDGVYGASNQQPLYMQFATTGSYTVQTTDYYSGVLYTYSAGTSWDAVNGGASMRLNQECSNTNSNGASFKITLYNPNSTTNNKYITINFGSSAGNITAFNMGAGAGVWKNITAITGIRFYLGSGNIYARKIKIYGVKNT